MEIASDKKASATYWTPVWSLGMWQSFTPAWTKQDKGRQWGKQRQKSTQSLSQGQECSYQPPACGWTIRHWEKIGAGTEHILKRLGFVQLPLILWHCFTSLWPCNSALPAFCSFSGPLMLPLSISASMEREKAFLTVAALLPGTALSSSLPHWLPVSLALTAEIRAAFSLLMPAHFSFPELFLWTEEIKKD